MLDNKTVATIGDYLIINGLCTNSASLLTGKAGIALTLFELSHALNDERISNYAHTILTEAMLINGQDHSIMHGTAGVGYTLLHLIDKGLIDAQFDELFADRHETIISHARQDLDNNNAQNMNPADLFYFAQYAKISNQCDELFGLLIDKAVENLETYATEHINVQNLGVLTLYYDQLATLLEYISKTDQFRDNLQSISQKLKIGTTEGDLPKSPVTEFLRRTEQELQNGVDIEMAITRNHPLNFTNTAKVMLVLVDWLCKRSDSVLIKNFKTILGA